MMISNVPYLTVLLIKYALGAMTIPENLNKLPAKMLHQYLDYQFMFHFDYRTYTHIDVFFRADPKYVQTTTLFNHDRFPRLERPSGYKYLHLVFLYDPFEFEVFSYIPHNLKYCDVVMIIIDRPVMKAFKSLYQFKVWGQPGLQRAGSVIVYDYNTNAYYYVKFFTGQLSGKIQLINTTEEIPKLLPYINDFSTFNGHKFKVGYTAFPPYIWCDQSPKSKECIPRGIEGNFLEILGTHMNFSYKMQNFHNRTPSPWPAMIHGVFNGEIDWAIGAISRTRERMLMVDFSETLKIDGYAILFSASTDDLQNWNDVLKPFTMSLWICFGCVLLFYSCLLHRAIKIVDKSKQNMGYFNYLLITYKAVVEQSDSIKSKSLVQRILFSTWSLSAIILTTAYKTNLASSMIKPEMTEPNSVNDLLSKNYYFQVDNEDWSVLKNNLMEANDKMFAKILARCRDNLDNCQALGKLFGNNIARIDEETPLKYQVFTKCENVTSNHDFNSLRFTRQQLFSTIYAWPFQLGSPFQPKISQIIQNLESTGHINKWYKSAFKKYIPQSNQQLFDLNTVSLNIQTFIAPAFMLLFGYICSIIIFVYETVHFKYIK